MRRHFADEDPIGKRIRLGLGGRGRPAGGEVVGVVRDVKRRGLAKESPPEIYVPYAQLPVQSMAVVLRSDVPPRSLATAVERVVHELDSELPVARVATLEEIVARSISQPRFYVLLLGAFAATALFLAALGLFGVMSYAVAQRTRELAVRMALGARRQELRRMVLREALVLGSLGLVLGWAARSCVSRTLESLLFSVSPQRPRDARRGRRAAAAHDAPRGLPAGPARDADRPGGRAARGLGRRAGRGQPGDERRGGRDRIGATDEPSSRRACSSPTTSPTCSRRCGCCSSGEGFEIETAASPPAVAGRGRGARLRRRADRPQLRARHHVGPRGPRPAVAAAGARPHAAGRRDDGVGQRRRRRRGDAPRRARLRPEAVGERAARARRSARRSSWRGRCGAASGSRPRTGAARRRAGRC